MPSCLAAASTDRSRSGAALSWVAALADLVANRRGGLRPARPRGGRSSLNLLVARQLAVADQGLADDPLGLEPRKAVVARLARRSSASAAGADRTTRTLVGRVRGGFSLSMPSTLGGRGKARKLPLADLSRQALHLGPAAGRGHVRLECARRLLRWVAVLVAPHAPELGRDPVPEVGAVRKARGGPTIASTRLRCALGRPPAATSLRRKLRGDRPWRAPGQHRRQSSRARGDACRRRAPRLVAARRGIRRAPRRSADLAVRASAARRGRSRSVPSARSMASAASRRRSRSTWA